MSMRRSAHGARNLVVIPGFDTALMHRRILSWALIMLFLLMSVLPALAQRAGAPAAAAPAPAETFDILEFEIEGNSVLPPRRIEEAVTPFLGERKSLREVEAAREALEKAYQDAGFLTVFVDIPEQKVDEGIVILRATEGRVARLKVAGARFFSQGVIRERVPALAEGEVPDFTEVQAQLAAVNRSDERRVTPVLRAGRTPGTVEAELKVEDRLPLTASFELNNRYSFDTTRLRAIGTLRYGNLWQREHSVSLSYQTTPLDSTQVRVWSGTYVLPAGAPGGALALYAVKSDSNVVSLGTTTILGRGEIVGARWIVPLPARGELTHSLTFGLDAKNFRESVLFGADTTVTPIKYWPMSIAWGGRVGGTGGATLFNLTGNFHFKGLGDEDVECAGQRINAFACRRFGADANYFYARLEVSRIQPLPAGLTGFARVVAQYANQPLISNEQFGAGGADTVRGYVEFERVGDHGVIGTAEVRSANLADAKSAGLSQAIAAVFVDGAALDVLRPLPGQAFKFRLASMGMGLRLRAFGGLTAAFDLAWPLRDGARNNNRDARLHARLAFDF
jgi:hemolysin activation/secretion protein